MTPIVNAPLAPLTREELIEITGYKKPSLQHKVLRESGVFAIFKRPTNSVFTTWHHVLNPIRPVQCAERTEPDFGALI